MASDGLVVAPSDGPVAGAEVAAVPDAPVSASSDWPFLLSPLMVDYVGMKDWETGPRMRNIFLNYTATYGVMCKGTGTKTKQIPNKNTGLKP
jgi:hypothetical protein